MESHEVLQRAIELGGPKAVADALGVSLSLIYKWAQPKDQGGAVNPLDRVERLHGATEDASLIEWLCHRANGYFVRNPTSHCRDGYEVLPATQAMVQKFADLLASISCAATDNEISNAEAAAIREVWDELKAHAEGFVRCCEEGDFSPLHAPRR